MPTKFASVSFNGKQIIPAPLVSVNRNLTRTSAGEAIGSVYNITLNGTIVAYRGSPASTGTDSSADWDGAFWIGANYPPDEIPNVKFDMLMNKIEHMRNLFNDDGGLLEIQSCDQSAPLKANCRIGELNFQEGPWTDTVKWSIPLEADYVLGGYIPSGTTGSGEFAFPQFLSDASETWDMQFNDQAENHERLHQHTFRLTHNLTARGKRTYGIDGLLIQEPWLWAKDWVVQRLGYDAAKVSSTGLFNLTGVYNGWNHVRSENIGYQDGSYSVTESWIISSGSALENFTVTSNFGVSDPIRQVTIAGDIQGLESLQYGNLLTGVQISGFGVAITKWESASGLFNQISGQLYERAYSYARANEFPRSLNPIPQSIQINRNPVQGNISYSYTFDTRRGLCADVSNVLSENLTISDNNPHTIIALIPIIGRANGPIIQDVDTVSEFQRTMTIDLVTLPPSACFFTTAGINSILSESPYGVYDDAFTAMQTYLSGTYDKVRKTADQDSWSNNMSAYSRTVTWTIGNC